jgi:hypothetical protein
MSRTVLTAALALACMGSPALARPRHHHHSRAHHLVMRANPRPAAWCGWFVRHRLHVKNRAGNRALWRAYYGRRAIGPAVGVIVVWSHGHGYGHVGIITGRSAKGWIVLFGNDGHAVRDRVRSVARAVAFRWP